MPERTIYASVRLTDLDLTERPRERLASLGAQALSSAELLAILLRTGVPGENSIQVGQRLLQTFGGLRGLNQISFAELVNQHGMGDAKAAQIKAAIELGRRLTLESPEERPIIDGPADAAALVQYEMSGLEPQVCFQRPQLIDGAVQLATPWDRNDVVTY